MSRVEVITLRSRGFLLSITREVILGREQVVRSGRQNCVLYDHPSEIAGRVEVLPQADRFIGTKAEEGQPTGPRLHSSAEAAVEENRPIEPQPDQEEGQASRGLSNVISAVFGRRA